MFNSLNFISDYKKADCVEQRNLREVLKVSLYFKCKIFFDDDKKALFLERLFSVLDFALSGENGNVLLEKVFGLLESIC